MAGGILGSLGSTFNISSITGPIEYMEQMGEFEGEGDFADVFHIVGEEALEEIATDLGDEAFDIVDEMIGGSGTVGQQSIMNDYIDGNLQDWIYYDCMDKHATPFNEWEEGWIDTMGVDKYAAVNESLTEAYDQIYGVMNRIQELREAMQIVHGVLAFMKWAGAGMG